MIKTLKSKAFRNFKFPIIIICSEKLFQNELKKLKTKINLEKFENKNNLQKNKIYIIDVPFKKGNLSLLKKNEYIKKSFDVGLSLLKKNNLLALINGPISKTTFLKGKYKGITEYLAFKTKTKNFAMLIYNKELSVCPLTTHLPLKKVPKKINNALLAQFWLACLTENQEVAGSNPALGILF